MKPGRGRRRQELQFLPEALEIQESPPAPVGRAVAWTVMVTFAAAVVWASLSTMDIVAVARGKLVPDGHSKVVQPLESGIIRAIHVRDGQAVQKGDVLLELDPTTSDADEKRLSSEHEFADLEATRLRAVIAGRPRLEASNGADRRLIALQEQRLAGQLAEYQGRLESARLVIDQRRAAVRGTRANIARLDAVLPMLTERATAYRKLFEQEYVAKMQYWEMEQQRIDKAQELVMQQHRLEGDVAALAEAEKQFHLVELEFKRSRLTELADAETRAAALSQEVVKAARRTSIQRLRAPIEGIVQQLSVHTVGGVLTPAQQVLVLVPMHHRVEVEAWIENKDIGFVAPGQAAEVKIDSFPFTRHGTIDGEVTTVSRDAVPLEHGALVYSARIRLQRTTLPVDDQLVSLSPGMAVAVEIKTGRRPLIEFFLSPLLRYVKESARER